jgi:hypothetical protein
MTLGSHQKTIGASQVLVVQCRDCGKTECFEGDLLNSPIRTICVRQRRRPSGPWKRVEGGLSMTTGSVAVRSIPPSARPRRRQSKSHAGRMPG